MMAETPRIQECRTAEEALHSLCDWFFEDRLSMEGCTPIAAEALPPAHRELLVHQEHMTKRLARYHGAAVDLIVLHHQRSDPIYSRNILLQLAGTEHIVEFGVVRMDLNCMSEAVRTGVLAGEIPLGAILIENEVMRRIEPKWYFRFDADAPMAAHFDNPGDVYGRVGIIHCDGRPAIELLEVVTDKKQPV
jgi:chorismate-pyruvate lyase